MDEREAIFQKYFERNGSTREYRIPNLGLINYQHIPLLTLKKSFPNELDAILNYESFACIRDPFERFASSFSQHVKRRISRSPIITEEEIKNYLPKVIRSLTKIKDKRNIFPIELIVFQPQVHFLYLDGKQVIKNIFNINDIDLLLNLLEIKIGITLPQHTDTNPRKNVSITYRNSFFQKIDKHSNRIRRPLTATLPKQVREKLRSLIYVPRNEKLNNIFRSAIVEDFVRHFYKEDIILWERLRNLP